MICQVAKWIQDLVLDTLFGPEDAWDYESTTTPPPPPAHG